MEWDKTVPHTVPEGRGDPTRPWQWPCDKTSQEKGAGQHCQREKDLHKTLVVAMWQDQAREGGWSIVYTAREQNTFRRPWQSLCPEWLARGELFCTLFDHKYGCVFLGIGITLPAERGGVSKNLPKGPRAKGQVFNDPPELTTVSEAAAYA